MVNRLSPSLQEKIKLIALLGIESTVDFEFHLSDWVPGSSSEALYKVQPEVQKLNKFNVLCFYGEDEPESLCPLLDSKRFNIVKMPGGHHFGGNYMALTEKILDHSN